MESTKGNQFRSDSKFKIIYFGRTFDFGRMLVNQLEKNMNCNLSTENIKQARIALIVNGESTLMNVQDVMASNLKIATSHGTQSVPDLFHRNQLFLGGDELSTVEVITSNPHCKGVGLMNNKLFWNPNLRIAERIIESGYGTPDQFRFYRGRMVWDSGLVDNIQQRNLYAFVSTKNNMLSSWKTLAKMIWNHPTNQNGDSLWFSLLQKTDSMDLDSWMRIYELINDVNVRKELLDLMTVHDAKIVQQVRQWGDCV